MQMPTRETSEVGDIALWIELDLDPKDIDQLHWLVARTYAAKAARGLLSTDIAWRAFELARDIDRDAAGRPTG